MFLPHFDVFCVFGLSSIGEILTPSVEEDTIPDEEKVKPTSPNMGDRDSMKGVSQTLVFRRRMAWTANLANLKTLLVYVTNGGVRHISCKHAKIALTNQASGFWVMTFGGHNSWSFDHYELWEL